MKVQANSRCGTGICEVIGVTIHLIKDILEYTELSDHFFSTIEPDGGFEKVEMTITIPDADLPQAITGDVVINGTNFENQTIDIHINLVQKTLDPNVQSALIAAGVSILVLVANLLRTKSMIDEVKKEYNSIRK